MKTIIIADDLTGALDTGVQFAAASLRTQVCVDAAVPAQEWERADTQVLCINAGTRHLSPEEAYCIVYDLCVQSKEHGASCVYKKTDSALRGNVGAELSAMRAALSLDSVPFVPSYPALGRVVSEGILYIDGIPAAQTALGHDPFDPLTSSCVHDLLQKTASREGAANIDVYDAKSDADMERIGDALGGRIFFSAGCSGFAQILAGKLSGHSDSCTGQTDLSGEDSPVSYESIPEDPAGNSPGDSAGNSPADPAGNSPEDPAGNSPAFPTRGVLVICGSLHANSLAQVQMAASCGYPVHSVSGDGARNVSRDVFRDVSGDVFRDVSGDISRDVFRDVPGDGSFETFSVTEQISDELCTAGISILATSDPEEGPSHIHTVSADLKTAVERSVASIAHSLCSSGKVNTLCVFGGDTLSCVMHALDIASIQVQRELLPGIVLGKARVQGRQLSIISKAGSFGSPDLISFLFPLSSKS